MTRQSKLLLALCAVALFGSGYAYGRVTGYERGADDTMRLFEVEARKVMEQPISEDVKWAALGFRKA